MFNKHQHIEKMINSKRNTAWIGVLVMTIFLASCSSVSDLPKDDVYYSRNTKTTGEYDWDNFQKSAQNFDNGNTSKSNTGDVYGGSTGNGDISTTVAAVDSDNDDQYIDDYYGSNYEERINRFGDNSSNNSFGYYDGYNNNSGCNCGQSNMSFGFGMGSYGYGSGWSMGYSYGSPYNYYGGSSYWAGYNAGYYNGYNNGYWGYPYYGYSPYYGYGGYYGGNGGYYGGGGYYDYASEPVVVYGPRGSGSTGTTLPRSSGSRSGNVDENEKSAPIVVGNRSGSATGRSGDLSTTGSGRTSTTGSNMEKPGRDVVVSNRSSSETQAQDRMKKPGNTTVQNRSSNNSRTAEAIPEPKYQKPKSYQSLPSQKPRSSQEYVRPTTKTPVTTKSSNSNPYVRKRTTTTTNSTSTRKSTYSPSRTTSSPTRTATKRSSYSSPSRNTGSSSYNRSSGSSTTRSSGGSVSRSSGSSSRSSSSGTRSSGGGNRR